SYIDHPLRDLVAQRIYQIASGYADGNDANSLRHDPLFKLSVQRPPLEPAQDLATAPTFSRLEHSVDPNDLYPLTPPLPRTFFPPSPPPPLSPTPLTPMPRLMASRNSRSTTTTIGVIAICRCSFSKGPHTP